MIKIDKTALMSIQQPAQYLGGELGLVRKDWDHTAVKWCVAFPDVYSIGMSYYGHKLLYFYINSFEQVLADRVYCPNHDYAEYLTSNSLPLPSIDYRRSLRDFDVLGFSLTYELNYTNLLWMLDLAGIPLHSVDRTNSDPIIVAGGHCTVNPEPVADFLDVVCVGEGEEFIKAINEVIVENKNLSRQNLLKKIAEMVPGAYVPCQYNVQFEDNKYIGTFVVDDSVPYPVKRTFSKDYPTLTTDITPLIGIPDARPVVEIMRGCPGNCRFCQAGYITRPIRPAPADRVIDSAKALVQNTGVNELALLSLSTLDHPEIDTILDELSSFMKSRHGSLNLPSLRVDSISVGIAQKLGQDLGSSLTFAPESGSDSLLVAINKNISNTAVLDTLAAALDNGYRKFKLYLMHGFSDNTEEIEENANLIDKVMHLSRNSKTKIRQLNVSLNVFIPKPFTPLQWLPMITEERARANISTFRNRIGKYPIVNLKWHDTRYSQLEGILCRSGRESSPFIMQAYKAGLVLQSWSEYFRWDKWQSLISELLPNLSYVLYEPKDTSMALPWDHIDIGVKKSYLVSEYDRFKCGKSTPKCSTSCSGCGLVCLK